MDALEQELVKDSIVSLNERGCIHWSVALRYAVSANEVYSYSLSIWWQLAALLGIRVDAVFGTSIGVLMLDCSSSVNKKKKWNKVFSRWLFYTPLSLQSKIWEMKRFKSGESQIAVGCNNHLAPYFFFSCAFWQQASARAADNASQLSTSPLLTATTVSSCFLFGIM